MNALSLGLSLSSSFTEVGAIAGFAALLGIALLSLLAFSQAREIKRLREWAGRAPERASELEQRVSAEAAARIQRTSQPMPPSGARVIPRKTPLVSAPVSTAVNATVASVVPDGAPSAQGPPVPGPQSPLVSGPQGLPVSGPSLPGAESTSEGQPPSPTLVPAAQVVSEGAGSPMVVEGAAAASANGEMTDTGERVSAVEPMRPHTEPSGVAPSDVAPESPGDSERQVASTPATAAARAAGAAVRPPLPPSPSAPAPPGVGVAPVSVPAASALPVSSGASAAAKSAMPGSRPPAPVAAARRSPSRAVGGTPPGAQARSPSPSRATGAASAAAAGGASVRPPGAPLGGGGPKYFKPERSAARVTAMIVGGVIVVALLLVFALSELKGGAKSNATSTTQSSPVGETHSTRSHTRTPVVAANPSEVAVVVLNGTSTVGLAHHLAADLRQSGYAHAAASTAVPPGTHAITVVQYTHGHRADGQAVAKVLDVKQVQSIEASTTSLVGSATVVVLAGTDQAAQLGGGGAQSKGEPAAGATGEAGTGAGGAAGEGAAESGQ